MVNIKDLNLGEVGGTALGIGVGSQIDKALAKNMKNSRGFIMLGMGLILPMLFTPKRGRRRGQPNGFMKGIGDGFSTIGLMRILEKNAPRYTPIVLPKPSTQPLLPPPKETVETKTTEGDAVGAMKRGYTGQPALYQDNPNAFVQGFETNYPQPINGMHPYYKMMQKGRMNGVNKKSYEKKNSSSNVGVNSKDVYTRTQHAFSGCTF